MTDTGDTIQTTVLQTDVDGVYDHIEATPAPQCVRESLRDAFEADLETEYERLADVLRRHHCVDNAWVESCVPGRHHLGVVVNTDDPDAVRAVIADHDLPVDASDRTAEGLVLQ